MFKCLYERVRPVGFEPTTPWSEAKCSNPLSYGRRNNSINW